ncbi:MAG: glycosyltransferase [Peptoniphilus sp.]|nr:glycosyltransferase [Peptoniphilus sp.]
MKVLLYTKNQKLIDKSGVGKAIEHQKKALDSLGIKYTTDSKEDFDIVQINTVFPASLLTSLKSKKKKIPVVYYAHSTEEDFKESFVGSNLLAPIFKAWISFCYNSGDVIITPTEYSKRLLKSYKNINKPIISLSNGIDTQFYKYDEENKNRFRKKYSLSPEDKVVMSAGHYIERKGIIEFVQLARELPQYEFYWFGYTSPAIVTKEVKAAVETKLPNLHFPGYINKEELRDAYTGSDLFLFLTHEETEGIVLLEALASKLPVLVRDIPVFDNWLKNGVNSYKAQNLEEFKDKIQLILEGEVPDLTEKGYQLALTRDLKNIGKELKKIYSSRKLA